MKMPTQPEETQAKRLRHPIILASGSPRRKELMTSLQLEFTVLPADVDEEGFNLDHLPPIEVVSFLSRVKAQGVFKHHTHAYVIGSDTMVALEGKLFGKPKNPADAFRMLNALQGQTHQVYSAVTIFNPDETQPNIPPFVTEALQTNVSMRPLSEAEIWAYIATGEPMDKAGAYAIQGLGSTLIERVDGCYFNVVGMSTYLLAKLFAQLGEPLL